MEECKMKQTFAIEGMSCAHCVAHVEKAVNELPGIKKVAVHLKKNNGVIKFDETQVTSDQIIEKINTDTNYHAHLA
ncbi:copper chaperone CopZ [Enterococcus italicus DSM 15952]|jgi:copper chaperone|uniref:Copper chaperone CopZ n=2 Tax=Enterococcus italicus TaxID=246144 RepID=E6LCH0_ENTI1|nr:copper chaperone CopZ [Enterococcus italicus DSM 15952]